MSLNCLDDTRQEESSLGNNSEKSGIRMSFLKKLFASKIKTLLVTATLAGLSYAASELNINQPKDLLKLVAPDTKKEINSMSNDELLDLLSKFNGGNWSIETIGTGDIRLVIVESGDFRLLGNPEKRNNTAGPILGTILSNCVVHDLYLDSESNIIFLRRVGKAVQRGREMPFNELIVPIIDARIDGKIQQVGFQESAEIVNERIEMEDAATKAKKDHQNRATKMTWVFGGNDPNDLFSEDGDSRMLPVLTPVLGISKDESGEAFWDNHKFQDPKSCTHLDQIVNRGGRSIVVLGQEHIGEARNFLGGMNGFSSLIIRQKEPQ
jgi:hypothetical protein